MKKRQCFGVKSENFSIKIVDILKLKDNIWTLSYDLEIEINYEKRLYYEVKSK